MPLYRVKPGRQVNQTGRIYTEKDEPIEVPRHVAYELRGSLEPVDDEGKFPPGPASTVRQGPGAQEGLRDHERLSVLTLQKSELERQLKFVGAQIDDIQRSAKEKAAAAAEQRKAATAPPQKPQAAAAAAPKPAQ